MLMDKIKKVIHQVKSSSFLKSVLSLSSGVVIGQMINTLGMPIIGRLYSASDMGDYTLIASRSNLVMSVAVLGMLTVFMLPKEDEESKELCRLVSLSSLIITSIGAITLLLLSPCWKLFQVEKVSYNRALLIMWCYVVIS